MTAPHWTAYVSALTNPIIALGLVTIGYRQWRTAQSKLKLDLFDRRSVIYEATKQLIVSVMVSGATTPQQEQAYLAGTRGAIWLFDAEIVRYLDKEIWEKVVNLGMYQSQLQGQLTPAERLKIIQEQAETKKWLTAQLRVIEDKFKKFLALSH